MDKKSDFPCPNVSRFRGYESPIDGKWISSDRQREQDLYKSGSYDPRDVSKDMSRGRKAQMKETSDARPGDTDPFWR